MRQIGLVAVFSLCVCACVCAASFGAVTVVGSAAPYSLVYSDPADLGTQIDQPGLATITESFGIPRDTFLGLNPQVITLDGGPVWGTGAKVLGSVVANYSDAGTVTFAFPLPGNYAPQFASGLGYNYGGANSAGRSAFSGANTSDHVSVIVSLADAGAGYNYNCFDARITTTGSKGVGAVGFCVSTRSSIACSACNVTFTLSDGSVGTVALPAFSGSTSHQKFFIGYQAPAGLTITRVQLPDIETASGSKDNMTLGVDDLSFVMVGGRVPGDVNGDGHVDVEDLLYVVDAFGSAAGDANYDVRCDFNTDDSVDVVDLLTLVENFGT